MALLTADQVAITYAVVSKRFGVERPQSTSRIAAMLQFAAEHASSAEDEPAAIFFAACRFPRAFPHAVTLMPAALAHMQLRATGASVRISDAEFDNARRDVHEGRATYADVRAFFAARRIRS